MEPLIALVFLISGAVIVIYTYFFTRHKERMAMIEKGMKAEEFKGLNLTATQVNPLNNLKWGLLAVFVGIGFFGGVALHEFAHLQRAFSVALVILFGGLGLIVFYFIASKKMKEEKQARS